MSINKLIVILGPTASGKSKLASRLAKKYKGEIINADSRQIFKKMLIATASPLIQMKNEKIKMKNDNVKFKNKPIKSIIINKVPHHLVHFIEPNQNFSVAEYKKSAIKTIKDIQKRGKLPILVGGTGLYISAVVDNLTIPEAPPNRKIRKRLESKSAKQLFDMLERIDPKSASTIGAHNKRKLIRSLEVYEITGKPFSSLQIKGKPLFNVLQIGIKTDRKKLYKKIDNRVDKMIENGLIEETKNLLKKYNSDLPAMTGIGYKEIGRYLKEEINLEEASQLTKFRTHQYARRQMTWFRRDSNIHWVKNFIQAQKLIRNFLAEN